jgi:hypothetical protein
VSEINHSASMRAKIEKGLKHLDALEAAGFQIIGYHLAGDRPTFTVCPVEEKTFYERLAQPPVQTERQDSGQSFQDSLNAGARTTNHRLNIQQPKDYAENNHEA